ncbi:T9SS type A sorting domain-containing protein [Soonwooa sp.]|uniref:T9SS type A sorting domain-containing protein n=2 Tax=Soonwooa sp. TaxID=1938592 RepID=UPI0035AFACF5
MPLFTQAHLTKKKVDIKNAEHYPTFTLNIHEDNAGKPGTIIKTLSNLEVKPPFGTGLYQDIQIDFPTLYDFPTDVLTKKYWLSVTTNDDGYPIRWVGYNIDDDSLSSMGSTNNGATWSPKIYDNGKGVDNIFQISGACTPTLATAEVNRKTIKVYPTPVKNTLYISSKEKIVEAQIYDMQGKGLKTSFNQSSISFANLPKGVYIVKMKDLNSNVTTEKVVKE